MTLDEAIRHCEEVSASCNDNKCGLEHNQLKEWLIELKEYRKKDITNKEHIITMNCSVSAVTDIAFEDVKKFCDENPEYSDAPLCDVLRIIAINNLLDKIKNGEVNFNIMAL